MYGRYDVHPYVVLYGWISCTGVLRSGLGIVESSHDLMLALGVELFLLRDGSNILIYPCCGGCP